MLPKILQAADKFTEAFLGLSPKQRDLPHDEQAPGTSGEHHPEKIEKADFSFSFMQHDASGAEKDSLLRSTNLTPRDSSDAKQRLRSMFAKDRHGKHSEELHFVKNMSIAGFSSGVLIGFLSELSIADETFKLKNKATLYASQADAGKRYYDYMLLRCARKGGFFGLRTGLFCGTWALSIGCLHALKGRTSLLDIIWATGLASAVFRVNMGLAGVLASGVLGLCMGSVAVMGVAPYFLITGRDVNDMYCESKMESMEKRKRKHREDSVYWEYVKRNPVPLWKMPQRRAVLAEAQELEQGRLATLDALELKTEAGLEE